MRDANQEMESTHACACFVLSAVAHIHCLAVSYAWRMPIFSTVFYVSSFSEVTCSSHEMLQRTISWLKQMHDLTDWHDSANHASFIPGLESGHDREGLDVVERECNHGEPMSSRGQQSSVKFTVEVMTELQRIQVLKAGQLLKY